MASRWNIVVIVVFLVGFLLIGMVGTSTAMTFIWPAYAILGVAGVLSVGLLFKELSFTLPRWTTLLSFVLAVYLLVRASESPVSYFAREDAALIIVAFLSYCLFQSLFSTGEWRMRLAYAIAGLILVNLGFALVQMLISPGFWLIPGYERTVTHLPGGLFNHPEHFTGFLAALVPAWLSLALFGRIKKAFRFCLAGLALLSTLMVVATGGATSQLALVSGAAVFACLAILIVRHRINRQVKRLAVYLVVAAFLLISALAFSASVPIGRQIERTLLTRGADTSLPLIWKAGFEQATESPLLGTGSRTSYIYGRLFRNEALGSSTAEPEFIHNEYLQILADYGVIGLLILIMVLGMHSFIGLRFVRAYAAFGSKTGPILPKSDHLALVIGALGVLASIATLSLFDFVMHLPVFVIVASVFLALLAAPDPMAAALTSTPSSQLIPGGSLMFMNRAVVFGCGIAMTIFGLVFSQSEYHYERARLSFEADPAGFKHYRHLQKARGIDPGNPFIYTLSAHAQVAGITPEMADPARKQALEQADLYFNRARAIYPQDVFAAVGHAAVLDELGKKAAAMQRIQDAREQAPHYGNVILAEAEHYLRNGKISEAERSYGKALAAAAFRDAGAAERGLRTITEWKLIAAQNGIDWEKDSLEEAAENEEILADTSNYRRIQEANIKERNLAAEASPAPASTPATGTASLDEPKSAETGSNPPALIPPPPLTPDSDVAGREN